MEIAPGSILQRIYFKKRIKQRFPSGFTFCEVGAGNGWNTNVLLSIGGTGVAYDLNSECCQNNQNKNKAFCDAGKLKVLNTNFIDAGVDRKFDVVFSCMVIEHLSESQLNEYMKKAKSLLNENGVIICLVPSSMKYWGIEDEIAGHFKRYEFVDVNQIAKSSRMSVKDVAGLTYPISNLLFRLSNYLIKKSESGKLDKSLQEKTELSGNREVVLKTTYPSFLRLILNEYVLLPLHWIQTLFKKNPNSMVIYFELALNE